MLERIFTRCGSKFEKPGEICYAHQGENKWKRYLVINIAHAEVKVERVEGQFYDGLEDIRVAQEWVDYIIQQKPQEITLYRDETIWKV